MYVHSYDLVPVRICHVFSMSYYTLSMRYTDIHILYIAVLDILNYMLLKSLENVEYHVRRV